MKSGEQLTDDVGWRDFVRRSGSALFKLALLIAIVAGGVWIYFRAEMRRSLREETAARNRLEAAGGTVISENGRYTFASFRPAAGDDEGFAALAWFTTVNEIEAP